MGRSRKTGEKEQKTRKEKKKIHDPVLVTQAMESVKAGRFTQRQAAKAFNIPFSTFNDKIVGKSPLDPQKRVLLLPKEESTLVKFIVDRAKCGFGLMARDDIRRTAQAIIDLRQPPEGDNTNVNMPSETWVYRLFERHPELPLIRTKGLGKKQATVPPQVTPQAISKWFQELRKYIVTKDPSLLEDGSRLYNADESSFAFDVEGMKVKALKGSKRVNNLTSNIKTQVTVLACMSATGHYLPPVMVYPYTRLPQKDLASGFPGAVIQASDNGWMTATIFYNWLQDSFIPNTKHVKKPLLLLVDGDTSHTSLIETSVLCQENGIILYCFVAHASHLIQPLDQAFFGSIKPAWAQATRHHIANSGRTVNLESFASVLKPVWEKSTTSEIAAQSFRTAGIFPFDPSRVLNSDKMATCVVCCTAQASSLPQQPASPGFPSATSLPEEPATPASPIASSMAGESLPLATSSGSSDPSSILQTLTVQQLKTIKEFGIFLYDDLLRKQFMRFLSVLAGLETAPSDDSFKIFQEHVVKIVNAFTPATSTPIKTPLAADILKIPKGNNTKKKRKKLTPTIPHFIGGEVYSVAMKRKLDSEQKEEKENKKKREERDDEKKERIGKVETRKNEDQRGEKKATKERELMKQRKEMAKACRARKEGSSSGEDEEMESQMLEEMTRADDDDDDDWTMEVQSDLCKGCHLEGDGELWLQCEICDGWWHKQCTKAAHLLNSEEIDQLQFQCSECIPDY